MRTIFLSLIGTMLFSCASGPLAISTPGKTLVQSASHILKVVAPKITIKIDGPRRIYINKIGTYNITVENKGDGSARDVIVKGTLNESLNYVSSAPPGLFKPESGNEFATVTWRFKKILPNSRKVIILRVRGKLGRVFMNQGFKIYVKLPC